MQWKLQFDDELGHDQKREILKKHYIKQEPFSKVSIHEMHVPEFVEHMLDSGLEIRINTKLKSIKCYAIAE